MNAEGWSQRQSGTESAETQTIVSMCGICPGGCGVYAHLVNGQLNRITPLENHPFPFGSPNTVGCNSLCYVSHGLLVPIPTLGAAAEFMFSDFENANLIVVW